jgi:DNA-binding transcriptional ArsR family regulator
MNAFSALSDPTRRTIVELLAHHNQLTASDIYSQFTSSAPAISQHLKILQQAQLVSIQKQAQKRLYSLNIETLNEVESWIQDVNTIWHKRFNRLDALLQTIKKGHHE